MNAEELRGELRAALLKEAEQVDNRAWRPMLRYLADLHARSIHPPQSHFPYPFEEIGPGYRVQGVAFGHIDLTHARLDTVHAFPEETRLQTLNELAGQCEDGLLPGAIGRLDKVAIYKPHKTFPPIWPAAVQAYVDVTGDASLLKPGLDTLIRQIGWFEAARAAVGGGFYYQDIVEDVWESGMDEGVRYDQRPAERWACVDATSHLYWCFEFAANWSKALGKPDAELRKKAEGLKQFIQGKLFDDGWFLDSWVVGKPELRHGNHEGMWPVVVGAATQSQADRAIDENILNPERHFSPHPMSTVALNDPKFELRMWRGPAWNCMTYWAATGCARYGRKDAVRKLMQRALDATAEQFERTGTIWEYYHPMKGEQESMIRKPHKGWPQACRDYVGHNPLFAMARLWRDAE